MASDKKPKRTNGGRGPALTSETKSKAARGARVSPAASRPVRKAAPKRAEGGRLRRLLRWLFSGRILSRIFSIGLTLGMMVLFAVIYFAQNLPDISTLGDVRKTHGIQVLSANGEIIASYGEIYGDYLKYKEFPKSLVDAVVATEDRRFFSHFGVDPMGIARAMVANFRAGKFVQGGSTITQQLAKNVFLTPDRTIKRKLQEMLLAFWLEARFSKEEILSIYLNRVYLGAGNFGVDAASRNYFAKSAREMTAAESAVIAGLLKAPSRYSPTSDPVLAKKRAHQVLLNMADADMMTEDEANRAIKTLRFPDQILVGKGDHYFTDWIVDLLPDFVSNVEEDIVIHTTLEPSLQYFAEEAVTTELTPEVRDKQKVSQASLLAMQPDGAIVALVGGRDYGKSQFNRAVQSKRQPGSAFKMFIYLAAMEAGKTPDDVMEDKPITIHTYNNVWEPKNYDEKFRGAITLRSALTQSINTIAAQLIQYVGPQKVVTLAKRLGVRSKLLALPSLALGSSEVTLLELTGAYAHLASGGQGVVPYAITEIQGKQTHKQLYKYEPPYPYVVVKPNAVAMMNSMLKNVIASGTGKAAQIGRPAAGKTGTASDYKDAWFMGYTPDLVAGVWVGNDNATPMVKVTGGAIPARIWKDFMSKALEQVAVRDLPTHYEVASQQPTLPWLVEGATTANPSEAVPQGSPFGVGSDPLTQSPQPVPQAASPTPSAPAPSARKPAPAGNKEVLDNGFWNKLFDEDKVEYSYPNQHRN